MNLQGRGTKLREDAAKLIDSKTHVQFRKDYGQELFDIVFDSFIIIILSNCKEHPEISKQYVNKLDLFCAAFY